MAIPLGIHLRRRRPHMNQLLVSLAQAALLVCLFAGAALSQLPFGTLLGTITDSSGAVIVKAGVTARNLATGIVRSGETAADGSYLFPSLPVGRYEISVASQGFKKGVVQSVDLSVGQTARVDLTLETGAVQETVTVAGRAAAIETDTSAQGTVINNESVVQLPLNGRNFQQLASLSPGVTGPLPGSSFYSVAGTRGTNASFLLDGASNSNINANGTFFNPSVDLIQEFKVMRNTFSAEFGYGASQISVVTKSGTNDLNFTLFEFLRNEKLQARNFFDRERKPPLRRNQFGGTIGGPVLLPKLYSGRNRTFWLFNYEGSRQTSPASTYSTIPQQRELQGDLSTFTAPVLDPVTRQPFPGNIIPASRINSTSAAFRQYMPVTTLPRGFYGTGLNFFSTVGGTNGFDQFTVKGDHSFGSSNQMFVRYSRNDNDSANPAILTTYRLGAASRQHHLVVSDNQIFSPSLLNELRLGYGRHRSAQGADTPPSENVAERLGLRNYLGSQGADFNAIPVVNITGFTSMGGPARITQATDSLTVADTLSWIKGAHTIKTGFDFRFLGLDIANIGPTAASFTFTGAYTQNALGDFLTGAFRNASATALPVPSGMNHAAIWQGFFQDDWRVARGLTLNLGLRYEYASPWVHSNDERSIFDPQFPGGRLLYADRSDYFVPGVGFRPGDPPRSRSLVRPDRNNLAPRFGFAWSPGAQNLSIRGSYGIFYDAENANNAALFGRYQFPHLLQFNITNGAQAQTLWSNLFPTGVTPGSTAIASLAENFPAGYVQQWSFNVQRKLAANLVLETGYIGSKATKLEWRLPINQARPDADPTRPTSIASRLPYPAFSPSGAVATEGLVSKDGFSTYHAWIARLERRFSGGLSFLASYTWAKMIDNASSAGNLGTEPQRAQNLYNLAGEKGASYYDVPHRLAVSSIWDLPIFRQRRGWTGAVLGGWQLSVIAQFQAGNPSSVVTGTDRANVGNLNQRPNVVGNPYPDGFVRGGPGRVVFDRAAFALAAPGNFGNSGRNIIRNAGLHNWDLGLNKTFRLRERLNLELRGEFFNAWNHTQFDRFINSIDSPAFATWNVARDPRIAQIGLKLKY